MQVIDHGDPFSNGGYLGIPGNVFRTKGSIVVLKSGGPKMTVMVYNEPLGRAFCAWFAGDELKEADFDTTCIEAG